jgi:hypothetical protein
MNSDIQLSKWWQTDSCKAAYQRVEDAKKAAFARMAAKTKAEKEAREKELAEWKEKPLDKKRKRAKIRSRI